MHACVRVCHCMYVCMCHSVHILFGFMQAHIIININNNISRILMNNLSGGTPLSYAYTIHVNLWCDSYVASIIILLGWVNVRERFLIRSKIGIAEGKRKKRDRIMVSLV